MTINLSIKRVLCGAAILFIVTLSQTPTYAQGEPPLSWRGCGITKKAFMRPCTEAYERETGQKITVSGGGAALGIRAAAGGSADLGGTCRHNLPGRFDSERGVMTAVIAWDALVAVTHPSNPVTNLRMEQMVDILRGHVTNWKEVGGKDQRIILGGRKGNESGVGVMMRELILNDLSFEFPANTVLLRSSRPLEQFLEKTPGTFAITGISSARKRNLKILNVDHVEPTQDNIVSGAYPFFRPLYLAYQPNGNPRAIRFIKWIQGESGQAVIEGQGTVTLEMGLPLVGKYTHWGDVDRVSNYKALLERARTAKLVDDSSLSNQ